MAAAACVASEIRAAVVARHRAVGIFASAPSQNEFLAALTAIPNLPWENVVAFHLDEYLGMDAGDPQSFRRFLVERLVSKVPLATFHGLPGEAADPQAACVQYAESLRQADPDFAALGIGENGHLAFIDPPYCDFDDPQPVKVVQLDEACRQQQVNEGAFASLDQAPRQALSLTIPTLMGCPKLFVIVPGPAKRKAVQAALEGPIATTCPASVLRRHPDAQLFLDRDSAELLRPAS